MYQLTRLQYIKKSCVIDGTDEDVLIEFYIDYRTNKKYILNKVCWWDFAYVKEYFEDKLMEEDMNIIPYNDKDEEIYGKNPYSEGSWRIETDRYSENFLTEIDLKNT